MISTLGARCTHCLTIAQPECECGKVACETNSVFGENELCVFTDALDNFEIVRVWLDDSSQVRHVVPIVVGKGSAKFVPTDFEMLTENTENG